MYFQYFLTAALAAASLAPWQATICQSQPPLQIAAGAVLSSQLQCPTDHSPQCQAILQFQDTNFLPYVVDLATDQKCPADDACVAEFIVPPGSPNGPATLFWLCIGQTTSTCVEVEISQGRGDAKSLRTAPGGTLQCEPKPPRKSPAAPITTAPRTNTGSAGTALPTPTKVEVIPVDRIRRHLNAHENSSVAQTQ